MNHQNCDVLIIGGGIVSLSLANQIIERKITKNIIIIEKEKKLGMHSSGRNSGVLHAGIYYKPDTIKAKVCVSGARRLKEWVQERGLPINECGKIVVPQKNELDKQLDVLFERGRLNGAKVEIWDEKVLKEFLPEARTASGRALWSPETVVVKPIEIIKKLEEELINKGVKIIKSQNTWEAEPSKSRIKLNQDDYINYGHLMNCSGLQADRIAHKYGVGLNYTLLPFKGLYWKLKDNCSIRPRCNLYPVPDLDIPFLGIHFTPSADRIPEISIGPTAIPALGRENYEKLKGIEPSMAIRNLTLLAKQYISNRGGFRRYVHEQAFMYFPPLMLKAAKELIPKIESENIEISKKVGIRSQLFNHKNKRLEDDFLCLNGTKSTHVLNAISPAFTASFALADLILDTSILTN